MDKAKKNTYIVAGVSLLLIIVAVYFLFIFKGSKESIDVDNSPTEVKQLSEIESTKRPYITLTPTSDGAEIIISIENMAEFDNIEYELTYLADNPQIAGERIERGSTGTDVNTKEGKYKKSILLGTASKGTRSPDKGITDGILTMHMFKSSIEYQQEAKWNIFQVGAQKSEVTDPSGNLRINLPVLGKEYFLILTDTIGIPRTDKFDAQTATLPIYGAFSIASKFPKKARVELKTETDTANLELFLQNHQDGSWWEIKTTKANGLVSGEIEFFGTFVLASSK